MAITEQPERTYRWSCPIEAEYYRNSIRPGLYACIGIGVFLLIFGVVLCFLDHDFSSFLPVAGSAAVFLLFSFAVFGLAFSATDPREGYEMTDTYVKTGSGKTSVYFNYTKVKAAVFTRKYIELQGKMKRMRVYMPEEDYDFVKRHIMNRLGGDCEIRYE